MRELAKNEPTTKKWNVSLKVNSEEEKKIKMSAIEKGMRISDYIKQVVLDNLSTKSNLTQGK